MTRSARGGFTLVELLVGMTATAFVAAALLKMVMVDFRAAEQREAWRTARQAVRSGLAMLTDDLQMVETSGGIEAAAAGGQDLTIRVPYAIGVLCTTNGSATTVGLMPTDSVLFNQPGHSGFAWRNDTTGVYTYVASSAPAAAAASVCATAGLTIPATGRSVTVNGTIPAALPIGSLMLLYRRVRYQIKASTVMPGQTALWRTLVSSGATEEIAAPFDPASRFNFFIDQGGIAQAAVPSPLSSMTGVQLAFTGQSDFTARGTGGPKTVPVTASAYFQNRAP